MMMTKDHYVEIMELFLGKLEECDVAEYGQ